MKKLSVFLLILSLLALPAAALEADAVAGTGTDTFYGNESVNALSSETQIGDLCADAARAVTGADIAILNSGDIGGNLPGGDIPYSECCRVFNDDRTLATVTVSPAQLRDILEIGVSRIVLTEDELIDRDASAWGGFPQISGFEFDYDVGGAVGGRIHEMRIDGVILDPNDTASQLTLCATEYMLSGGWGYGDLGGGTPVELTLSEALFRYVEREGTVSPAAELERIDSRGSKDDDIWRNLKVTPLLLLIALLIYGGGRARHFRKYEDLEYEPKERPY